jgi:hypothetical protein
MGEAQPDAQQKKKEETSKAKQKDKMVGQTKSHAPTP